MYIYRSGDPDLYVSTQWSHPNSTTSNTQVANSFGMRYKKV